MSYNAKDIDPITIALCRGMFRYDANEVLPESGKGARGEDRERHDANSAD